MDDDFSRHPPILRKIAKLFTIADLGGILGELLRAANRGKQRLAQQRGFAEGAVVAATMPPGVRGGAVVAKTPPDSGKRTIIGGRKAQIGPFSGMRDAARKTLRQNPRSENCAPEARLPAESPTTDYRRFA